MKNILRKLKETLLTTLFAIWLGASFLSIILIITKTEVQIKDLWKFPLSFILPILPISIGIYYYLPLLPSVIVFCGLVNSMLNRLAYKHNFTFVLKNKTKTFNFFFKYFIKGVLSFILGVILFLFLNIEKK